MFKIKSIFFITILLFVSSCTPEPGFEWLVGTWERTNDQEGNQTFETWVKVNDTEYLGTGITLNNSKIVFQETILLKQSTTGWNFEVTGIADSIPTIFEIWKSGPGTFTCRNLQNEFPTHIQYKRDGDNLKASIWADDTKMEFEFKSK